MGSPARETPRDAERGRRAARRARRGRGTLTTRDGLVGTTDTELAELSVLKEAAH